jgi:3-hydroxyacyl-[acyl-carrier-protein] dehydratase
VSLPVAAPLRAVDHVDVQPRQRGWTVHATKTILTGDPYLVGHFPEVTVYPAVFVIEGVSQAVVAALGLREGALPQVTAVRSARFLAPILPGHELRLEATVEPTTDGAFEVAACCRRGDGIAAAKLALEFRYPGGAAGAGMLGHADILKLLPQRWPMLLVDRVVGLESGRSITALKAVTASESCYQGLPDDLPPERYAYPISLVLESFGQAAAILWLHSALRGPIEPDVGLMFAAARRCRIEGRALPGDVLRHEVRLNHTSEGAGFAEGETWVDQRRVAVIGLFIAVARPWSVLEKEALP